MLAVILLASAIVIFVAAMVAARSLSILGAAIPVAIVYALGEGWEWDPDAIPLLLPAGVIGALGFIAGLVRRVRVRRGEGLSGRALTGRDAVR